MTEQELSNAMRTYGDAVYRLALCRTQNAADAEDVYQDVFLRLLEQRTAGWDGERTKAWLLRAAMNRCADLGRARKRQGAIPLDEVPDMARPVDEAAAELWEAVGRLPEKLRTAVHLFYGEGYESGEIGALLGVPAATVRSRLRRARAELKNLLGGFDDGESISEADGKYPYARRAE